LFEMNEAVLANPSLDPHFGRLTGVIGRERSLHEVSQILHFLVNGLQPRVVGAMLVTCADETETECAEALQHGFARFLLPPLKSGRSSPMRLANLGSQYEWGAARLVDQHYLAPSPGGGFRALLVKINAHVGVMQAAAPIAGSTAQAETRFGVLKRYGVESPCCGALGAFLSGSTDSFAERLHELFDSEGLDRRSLLVDPARTEPSRQALAAAVVSSRLQARKAVLDVLDHVPSVATFWLIVPCVTLNREERDTEIVCGLYVVDGREMDRTPRYRGLGDDPTAYKIHRAPHGWVVEDEHMGSVRDARDHRALVREEWSRRRPAATHHDERLDRIRRDVAANTHRHHGQAKALLRAALPVLAEIAPIPAAVVMFAEGAAGLRHAFRIHKLTRELEGSDAARQILDEVHARVDELDQDRAQALIELLVKEYSM
jgi:hypothetical protein